MGRRAAGGDRTLKLRLVSVGKDRDATAALCADYAKRIRRFAGLELVELRAAGPQKEAWAILSRAQGELWALDARGMQLSSEELAQRLGRARDAGLSLTFCIGGDEGLAQAVRDEARFVLGLSRLTLPHRLARVLLLEQVYRAFEILRGGPYHK